MMKMRKMTILCHETEVSNANKSDIKQIAPAPYNEHMLSQGMGGIGQIDRR
jgi:hypothetical protein